MSNPDANVIDFDKYQPTAAQVNTARLTLSLIESGPLHYRGKKTPEVRRAVARLVLSVTYPHLAAVLGGKE